MARTLRTRYTRKCPKCGTNYEERVYEIHNSGEYNQMLHITDGCPLCIPDEKEDDDMLFINKNDLIELLKDHDGDMISQVDISIIIGEYADAYIKSNGLSNNWFKLQESKEMKEFKNRKNIERVNPEYI